MALLSFSKGPKALGPIESFAFGFSLPLRAAKVVFRHPVLIFWSALPISLTLFLYFYVISALQSRLTHWVAERLPDLGASPDGWIATSVMVLVKVVLFLVGAFTFSIIASIVASPFNDFLAESSEKWTELPLSKPLTGGWTLRARLIAIDLAKTAAATAATVIALLISWIPAVNILGLLIAALLVCFQYISYAQTRRSVGLWGGLAFLLRHLFACAGFGIVLTLIFAVPIVSSLCLPFAVVGGTLLVARAPGDARLGRLR